MTTIAHDYVGMPLDGVIYVIVAQRAKFDAIELPETSHTNGCHSKRLGDMSRGTTTIIFQWWPDKTASPSAKQEAA